MTRLRVWKLALSCCLASLPLFGQTQQEGSSSPIAVPEISGKPLTAEQEKEALEYMLADGTDRAAAERKSLTSKTRAPEVYWAHLRTMLSHKQQMAHLRNEDPKTYDLYQRELALHRKVNQITSQYRAANTDANRSRLRTDLNTALGELFDVREEHRLAAETARLQREMRDIQAENAKRKAEKSQVIAEQLRQRAGS